ncbi:MAG TPA: hypothetical protein VNA21_11505 [Steroidobacteraceae bacterium]|nr:hypothetical protein [Steroidobacteraceae bacterium]
MKRLWAEVVFNALRFWARCHSKADVDEDGIPDAIDVEPAQRGSRADNDKTGVGC